MTNLEDHLVWIFSLAKAKSCPEILLKELSVSVLLQGLHQALVHGLLVSLPLLAGLVGLLLGLENVSVLKRKETIGLKLFSNSIKECSLALKNKICVLHTI